MRRIQDKVKDIVEVRPFRKIRDFTADPAETLEHYRFTDATADLMAKWLEGISTIQPGKGAAFALAGYRGVGKSHFLATLGALASSPDLRGRVSEPHVEFSAQRLQRRHYPVCHLKRGTHATLLDEFKASVMQAFQLDSVKGMNSFREVLDAASEKFSDAAWVLMIDTALERGSRVTRDDGEHLSEIAEAAKARGVFVGVALDDDIAGADGSNSAIVRSFSIDYLDQAHLYKVVNSHVFPKAANMQPVLHEVYSYFREVLPSFRWSEQRFSALYPLHPAILEVAPYVRLYVHEFALLGFASEAGERIMGRPANSLIALDEVYDNAENGLRKIDDLRGAFSAYDAINSTVVGKVPVMQRLQAKLILKALLMLSLDGQGATASEICASELIFDEAEPQQAVETVEGLLRTFADALPDGIRVTKSDAGEVRYGFKVTSKESLNNALAEAVSKAPADAAQTMLRRVFQERFPESAGSDGSLFRNEIRTELLWRGAVRPGRILWPAGGPAPQNDGDASVWTDWEVHVHLENSPGPAAESAILWRPDLLRPEELEKLRSYYVLTFNADLRDKFSEQIRAALHAHSMAAEKILTRTFLEDAKLVIDGFDYNFTEEARAAQTLPEIFGSMLEPLFETRYPSHPYFAKPLGHDDVSSVITDLYDGTKRDLSDTQSRAQAFAFPLGLVRLEGTAFVPETADRIESLASAKTILDAVDSASGSASLAEVNAKLRQPPFGLVREAQQILITALVAERLLEFVTTSGNRINSRSLDLRIIWDDIVGLARPVEVSSAEQDLSDWAKLFVKESGFTSLRRVEDRQILLDAFEKWRSAWESERVLERFAELPEDLLNVGVWRLAARATKTFGTVSDKIGAAAKSEMPAEECLSRIAEAFSFSPEELTAGEADLEALRKFVNSVAFKQTVREYIAAAEITEVEEVEATRLKISALLGSSPSVHGEGRDRELSYAWDQFRRDYGDHFASRHAEMASKNERKAKLDELMRGPEWTEFEFLSRLPAMDRRYPNAADQYRRQLAELECRVNVRPLLELQPFCNCGFSLRKSANAEFLQAALSDTIKKGLEEFRKFVFRNSERITSAVLALVESSQDADVATAGRELISALRAEKELPRFTDLQLKIFAEILREQNEPLVSSSRKPVPSVSPPGREESFASPATEEFADSTDLLLV